MNEKPMWQSEKQIIDLKKEKKRKETDGRTDGRTFKGFGVANEG